MAKSPMIAWVDPLCVACGTCMKACPLSAIQIPDGLRAVVDPQKCVGCRRCFQLCPASIITMIAREVTYEKKEME